MGLNLKVGSIVVATLAIAFASLTLTKTCFPNPNQVKGKQVIDQGGIVPKKANAEPWAATEATPTTTNTATPQSHRNQWEAIQARWNQRTTSKTERIIIIIMTIISVTTSFMVFDAVSDDRDHNQQRRHMLIPFVVFHTLVAFFHAVAVTYFAITYRAYMDMLLGQVLVYISLVFVYLIGISIVASYFRSLTRMSGFKYAQMEDVPKVSDVSVFPKAENDDSEVKIPLA
jgi:hypothetical protein